jgi:hypothetical protein
MPPDRRSAEVGVWFRDTNGNNEEIIAVVLEKKTLDGGGIMVETLEVPIGTTEGT